MTSVLLAAAVFALAKPAAALSFTVENDHTNLIYRVGEEATFTVAVREGPAEGFADVTLDNCGPKVLQTRRVDLGKENPFVVRGRLDEPGFLRLTVKAKDAKACVWGVGYEPEKIEKGSPSPADFDAYWAAARAKLAKDVPLDAQMTRVPERSTADFDYYRISFATFGRRVYGYMSVPTDRSKAPYPVEVNVAAAGFGGWTNDMSGEKDLVKVFFSVYPWAPQWEWERLGSKVSYDFMNEAYAARYGCNNYTTAGLSKSREEYFFYPVVLGILRGVDWVASRPDVDASRFWYQGTSQGGGFGFYLTALSGRFTRATLFVPALTDTMGYRRGRQSGWPKPVENNGKEMRAVVEGTAPYFDAANFASRITCPVRVVVGFSDVTCPPCAVYAAYNAIMSKDKAILHGFGMPHACFDRFYEELAIWRRADPIR